MEILGEKKTQSNNLFAPSSFNAGGNIGTFFKDESTMYNKLMSDGISDEKAREVISYGRSQQIKDVSDKEISTLQQMAADGLDSKTATSVLKKIRYNDMSAWEKAKTTPYAGVVLKQIGAIGQGAKEGIYKFGADVRKVQEGDFKEQIISGKVDEDGIERGLFGNILGSAIDRERNFSQRKMEQGDIGQTKIEKGLDYFGQGTGLINDIVGEGIMSGIQTVATDKQEEWTKAKVTDFLKSPDGQLVLTAIEKGTEGFAEFEKTHPRLASQARNLGNVVELYSEVIGVGEAGQLAKKGGKAILNKTDDLADFIVKSAKNTGKKTKQIGSNINTKTSNMMNKSITKAKNLTPKTSVGTKVKDLYNKGGQKLDDVSESISKKMLGSSDGKKELFQATSPSYATLGKDKNIKNIGKNIEAADEAVLKYGYTPTNTETRAIAYNKSMKDVWKQVEEARGGTPLKTKGSDIANKIDEFIETKKINGKINPEHTSDITALQKQADYLRGLGDIDVPTLGKIRGDFNALTSFKQQNPLGDVYNTGLKNIGSEIRNIENELIESVTGTKFGNLMQEYKALAETYPDILKANIKNMRSKGASLEESLSRVSGLGDIAAGSIELLTNPKKGTANIVKGLGKSVLGKSYSQLKDADFLIEEGYKKLLKTKGLKNVDNLSSNIPSTSKYSKVAGGTEQVEEAGKNAIKKDIVKKEVKEKKVLTDLKKKLEINSKANLSKTEIKELVTVANSIKNNAQRRNARKLLAGLGLSWKK